MMRSIRSLFPWHRRGLRPFEKAVLDSLEPVISPGAWTAVQEQIDAISASHNDVTRKEVSFSFDRHFTKWLLPSAFPGPLAMARCRSTERAGTIRATVLVDSGQLAFIVYSERPEPPRGGEFSVQSAEVIFDPLDTRWRDGVTTQRSDVAKAPVPIQELIGRVGVKEMRAPLVAGLRDAFLLPARDCVPSEYVELLPYTNAFQFNGWNFTGLPLDEIAMDGPNHFVLAESSEEPLQLHAVDGDSERKVYLYDYVDDEGRCLGESFLAALQINPRSLRQ